MLAFVLCPWDLGPRALHLHNITAHPVPGHDVLHLPVGEELPRGWTKRLLWVANQRMNAPEDRGLFPQLLVLDFVLGQMRSKQMPEQVKHHLRKGECTAQKQLRVVLDILSQFNYLCSMEDDC